MEKLMEGAAIVTCTTGATWISAPVERSFWYGAMALDFQSRTRACAPYEPLTTPLMVVVVWGAETVVGTVGEVIASMPVAPGIVCGVVPEVCVMGGTGTGALWFPP